VKNAWIIAPTFLAAGLLALAVDFALVFSTVLGFSTFSGEDGEENNWEEILKFELIKNTTWIVRFIFILSLTWLWLTSGYWFVVIAITAIIFQNLGLGCRRSSNGFFGRQHPLPEWDIIITI
jgi:hypothetical protein